MSHSSTFRPMAERATKIERASPAPTLAWASSSDSEDTAHKFTPDFNSIVSRLWDFVPRMSAMRLSGEDDYRYYAAPTEDTPEGILKHQALHRKRLVRRRSRRFRICWLLARLMILSAFIVLALFGVFHISLVVLGRTNLFWDLDQYKPYLEDWGVLEQSSRHILEDPSDATRGVVPIPCHSHNDYWRKVPLFDALRWGCTGIGADVWLLDGEDELYIGHSTAALTPNRTFSKLYIDPLVRLLNSMNPQNDFDNVTSNGVFDEDPKQTFVLSVDFKANGYSLFPQVYKQLEPLRERNHLSYWNGHEFIQRAITAVGTGNTPFDLITENQTYRDIFFDAPLGEMWEPPSSAEEGYGTGDTAEGRPHESRLTKWQAGKGQGKTGTAQVMSADAFDTTNSYYASTSFAKSIGFPWTGLLSTKQLELLQGQIRGAQRRGLKARYWATPGWPTSLRNYIWKTLIEEGADMLNVDDLKAAASLDWDIVRYDWFDG